MATINLEVETVKANAANTQLELKLAELNRVLQSHGEEAWGKLIPVLFPPQGSRKR